MNIVTVAEYTEYSESFSESNQSAYQETSVWSSKQRLCKLYFYRLISSSYEHT